MCVHSQADTAQGNLALERAELKAVDKDEHKELPFLLLLVDEERAPQCEGNRGT
jgi:hypothetical protein